MNDDGWPMLRVETNHGPFFFSVETDKPLTAFRWTLVVLEMAGVAPESLRLLKRASSQLHRTVIVERDGTVHAGKLLWQAAGRGVEYEATMVVTKKALLEQDPSLEEFLRNV